MTKLLQIYHARKFFLVIFIAAAFTFCSANRGAVAQNNPVQGSIIKMDLNLSVFGVESDNIPAVYAIIDFQQKSGKCKRTFDNPAYKDSSYFLTQSEMDSILKMLSDVNLEKLTKEYNAHSTDQPASTINIYTNKRKFTVKDYGLIGDYPLQEIYKIVYKLR